MNETKEMNIVHIDGNPQNNLLDNLQPENNELKEHEWISEYLFEIVFTVQEWGNKNMFRLFGIEVNEYYNTKTKILVPHAKGFFTDNRGKDFFILHFDIKKTGEKISLTRKEGFKYPIKVLRTNKLITRNIDPVLPFYNVLIGRGMILPFQSQVKGKKRDAFPFEDMGNIKAVKI